MKIVDSKRKNKNSSIIKYEFLLHRKSKPIKLVKRWIDEIVSLLSNVDVLSVKWVRYIILKNLL